MNSCFKIQIFQFFMCDRFRCVVFQRLFFPHIVHIFACKIGFQAFSVLLQVCKKITHQYLLLTGKLNEHLNQTDQEAREQVEMLMKQMAEKKGVTEELKVQDQMKWVGLMNNIKVSAEEIILKNMVYV